MLWENELHFQKAYFYTHTIHINILSGNEYYGINAQFKELPFPCLVNTEANNTTYRINSTIETKTIYSNFKYNCD